jgi:hypothetical protein
MVTRMTSRVRKEKIEVNIPFEILDLIEDLSHHAYMSHNDFVVQCIRIASPQLADKLGDSHFSDL